MKKRITFLGVMFFLAIWHFACIAQTQVTTFTMTSNGIVTTGNTDLQPIDNWASGSTGINNGSLYLRPPSSFGFVCGVKHKQNEKYISIKIQRIQVNSSIYGWAGAKLILSDVNHREVASKTQPKKERWWVINTNAIGSFHRFDFSSFRVPYLYDWERTAADKAEVYLHSITVYWTTL
ncbi:MAG: hypothetical protein KJ578_12010 [Bacteroidetes bacterium]|jgi:hypothetical protein|nr:hypothetical protein [Bacteroidota bacterium]MBU1579394.1 hypothetical protein [Bacteroidota bacterium]MBU2465786.1 hypothetical protein [Bacteroidota bacterium]MBU2558495.1 hypothetical protein [Bacteroidota bacterium]